MFFDPQAHSQHSAEMISGLREYRRGANWALAQAALAFNQEE